MAFDIKKYHKEYAKKNKKYISDYHKKWYLENKKRIKKVHSRYYNDNKEKIKKVNKEYIKNNPYKLESKINRWKSAAIKRGIKWSLSIEDLYKIPFICHYTGIKLTKMRLRFNTASLDRIDNKKGYIKGNVVFCCKTINIAKMSMSKTQFINMCKKVAAYND